MEKKTVTIKDIANLAGVSKGTVDRVIHNRGRVSEKALKAVNDVIHNLEFKPNLIARHLKQNKRFTIGVILPDPNIDPYWTPCLSAIEITNTKYNPLGIDTKCFFYNPKFSNSYLKTCLSASNKQINAVLLSPLFYKQTLKIIDQFKSNSILISTFNNHLDTGYVTHYVGQDLFKSGRVAAHLMHTLTPNNLDYCVIHIDEAPNNAIHMLNKEKGFRHFFNHSHATIKTLKLVKKSMEQELIAFLKTNPETRGLFITTSKAHLVVKILSQHKIRGLKIIGYDLLQENIKQLKLGKISYLINQNPKEQVLRGLSALCDHFLLNSPIAKQSLLPIDIISSENVDSYLINISDNS